MNINSSNSQIRSPQTPPQAQPTPPKQEDGQAKEGSILRDVASIGAGIGGGIAGGTYGLAEGLVKGGIKNYPTHVAKGADIGKNIATPVGGALGAIATGIGVAGAAIMTPVATVMATGLRAVVDTGVSALRQTPAAVVETGKKGADIGAGAGQRLGKIGETVGRYVGGAVGGVAGLFVALGRGVPDGVAGAKEQALFGVDLMKGLPNASKEAWNVFYPGGRKMAGAVGSVAGGAAGVGTATIHTGVDGAANSLKRGAQWSKAASDFVGGKRDGTSSAPKVKPEASPENQ
jgi:hypothetical protein